MSADTVVASRLAIAAIIGLAAGLEREWSGHASGDDARFAGIRTFFLLGLIGGVGGAFVASGREVVAAALVAVAGALCVAGYAAATRRPTSSTDGTTEAAALAIVALGALAGTGEVGLAAGAGAIVVLLLREKERVHWLVRRLGEPELRAGLQFAVLAVVVLPLLPVGPYFGLLALRPRSLWEIVLLFSALHFAGFVARRTIGATRGLTVTGAFGGVISSTAVTLNFSRQSRGSDAAAGPLAGPLASGVFAACAVLVPRVLIVTAILNRDVALRLAPLLVPMFLVGIILVVLSWRGASRDTAARAPTLEDNPLRLGTAVRMTALFQIAMIAVAIAQRFATVSGLYATSAVLGFTDVDALTVSLSRTEASIAAGVAARAIVIGIIANTVLKLSIAVVVGRAPFRRRVVAGLTCIAVGGALGLLLA